MFAFGVFRSKMIVFSTSLSAFAVTGSPPIKKDAPLGGAGELPTPESFEAAMNELESLVQAMDSPAIGLDELLKDYRRGAQLVKYCRDKLQVVRQEVEAIEVDLKSEPSGGAN